MSAAPAAPLRLSVTMLDTYVHGMADEAMSSAQLAYELFARKKPSQAMRVGTSFHRLLEKGLPESEYWQPQLLANPDRQGFYFILPDDLTGTIELGDVREQRYEWPIFDDVVLVGKIDAETASKVIDHKLTARFDPERYMDSLQWRAYLAMRNKARFSYQVFEHSGLPSEPDALGHYPVLIKAYHCLEQYRYVGMMDEVKDVVHDLARFARTWQHEIQQANGSTPDHHQSQDADFQSHQSQSHQLQDHFYQQLPHADHQQNRGQAA